MNHRGYEVFLISAAIGEGTKDLMNAVAAKLAVLPQTILLKQTTEEAIYRYEAEELFTVVHVGKEFSVQGPWIQNLVNSTNFDDSDSLQYFQRIIRKRGVIDELKRSGIKEGDLVKMYDLEFDYIE